MQLPIPSDSMPGLVLAAVFGILFGVLLNKGRVTDYNVIVNLFRLKDFTVMRVMLTAIVVGGVGVAAMMGFGWLEGYHVKGANLLALLLGGSLFGIGMVVYGYCPGTGVAAVATGSLHALMGFAGMLAGGVAYAYSYSWLREHVLGVWSLGKVRLADVTPVPEWGWFVILALAALALFRVLSRMDPVATNR